MELERISVGNGGWVRLHLDGRTAKPYALVRFSEAAPGERLTVCELYLHGTIRGTCLKFLDVPKLEDIANQPQIADLIRRRLDVIAVDLGALARYYATTPVPAIPERTRVDRGASYTLGPVDCHIDVPTTTTYPDSFYATVATLYHALTARGLSYAREIAATNDVAPGTVHRWVREARRRGVLAPARRNGIAGTER